MSGGMGRPYDGASPAWRNWQRTRLVIGRLGVRFPSPALGRAVTTVSGPHVLIRSNVPIRGKFGPVRCRRHQLGGRSVGRAEHRGPGHGRESGPAMLKDPELGRADDRLIVTIAAQATPRAMRQTILDAMGGFPRDLVVDLRGVHAMPDAAVALLVGVSARQRARRRGLTLVCLPGSVTELALRRNGLARAFTIAAALAAVPRT
jgi:anti-anti-sigma regulatory factor